MARVVKAREAAIDLDEIWLYLAHEASPSVADRFLRHLAEKMQGLAENPLMGRDRSDRRPDLRSWPVGSYMIFYRALPDGIEVVRVLHGSRDIDSVL